MQCPKFQFGADDRVIRREDGSAIPTDEPLFLIRGKDEIGLRAIARYIEICERYPDSVLAKEHAASAKERLEAIKAWQAANPDRTGMGCHSCTDPACREHLPDLDPV